MRVCPKCSTETELLLCPDDGAPTIDVQDSAPATYPAGTVIGGRYVIESVLGIGGFGAVYRCKQTNMDQVVAVKVLRTEHLASLEHVKRFTREAQTASKLRHPNTISIFDFGQHSDGALYLAMEFVEGETLGRRLDTHRTVHWDTLVPIMVQVCNSLTEAHAAGLIHRDLKPENIMLVQVAGDPNFVKVLDFGIAKTQKVGAGRDTDLTEAGMIMGTPTYMSPEQARGEAIDARSDIYALGVMMYEALVGRAPFAADAPMAVLVAHIKDPPPPMVRQGTVIPPEMERVVLACLAKNPADRPQTTQELAVMLNDAAQHARMPVTLQQTRSLAAGGATAGIDIVHTAMLQAHVVAVQEQIPAQVPPPPVPNRAPMFVGIGAFLALVVIAALVALTPPSPPAPATPSAAESQSAGAVPGRQPANSGSPLQIPQSPPTGIGTNSVVTPPPAPLAVHPALADKAVADKAAAEKANADKALADRALADKAAADRALADRAAADRAHKAADSGASRAIADRQAAEKAQESLRIEQAKADRAQQERAAAEKATAERLAADKAAQDKAAADKHDKLHKKDDHNQFKLEDESK